MLNHHIGSLSPLIMTSGLLLTACQVPTAPHGPLPFDTTPRITQVLVEVQAPTVDPVPVNVLGDFFLEGISLTVLGPDSRVLQLQGREIRELTGSSFEVDLPLTVDGVYFLRVRTPSGLTSDRYALAVGQSGG